MWRSRIRLGFDWSQKFDEKGDLRVALFFGSLNSGGDWPVLEEVIDVVLVSTGDLLDDFDLAHRRV